MTRCGKLSREYQDCCTGDRTKSGLEPDNLLDGMTAYQDNFR